MEDSIISIKVAAVLGVSSAGLKTQVFPQTRAGNIFHVGIAIGKFHGVINPPTPIGTLKLRFILFWSSLGAFNPKSLLPSEAA